MFILLLNCLFFTFKLWFQNFDNYSLLQNQMSKIYHKKQQIFCPIFSFLLFAFFICDFVSEFWPEDSIIIKKLVLLESPNYRKKCGQLLCIFATTHFCLVLFKTLRIGTIYPSNISDSCNDFYHYAHYVLNM